jgi:hypothetical protein
MEPVVHGPAGGELLAVAGLAGVPLDPAAVAEASAKYDAENV